MCILSFRGVYVFCESLCEQVGECNHTLTMVISVVVSRYLYYLLLQVPGENVHDACCNKHPVCCVSCVCVCVCACAHARVCAHA